MGNDDGKPPKWNFTDFVFSFLMVNSFATAILHSLLI